MLRRILIVLGIILIGVIVWLWIGVSRVINAEHDVMVRFHDVVQYYVSMDQDYVVPLLASSGQLSAGDTTALRSIDKQMRDLGSIVSTDDQYDKLLVLQKAVIAFVGTSGYPEAFANDARYQQWNKNSTNLGQASVFVKSYDEALSLYNARLNSTAGQLAGLWKRWAHHQYLGIDGSLQNETRISF